MEVPSQTGSSLPLFNPNAKVTEDITPFLYLPPNAILIITNPIVMPMSLQKITQEIQTKLYWSQFIPSTPR